MTSLQIFLLVINIIFYSVVVIMLIFAACEFYTDRERVNNFLKKHKIPLTMELVEAVGLISFFISLVILILRVELGFA